MPVRGSNSPKPWRERCFRVVNWIGKLFWSFQQFDWRPCRVFESVGFSGVGSNRRSLMHRFRSWVPIGGAISQCRNPLDYRWPALSRKMPPDGKPVRDQRSSGLNFCCQSSDQHQSTHHRWPPAKTLSKSTAKKLTSRTARLRRSWLGCCPVQGITIRAVTPRAACTWCAS